MSQECSVAKLVRRKNNMGAPAGKTKQIVGSELDLELAPGSSQLRAVLLYLGESGEIGKALFDG